MLFHSELKLWNSLRIIRNSTSRLIFKPQSTPVLACRPSEKSLSKHCSTLPQFKFINALKSPTSPVEQRQFLSTSHKSFRKKGPSKKKYDDLDEDDEIEDENDIMFNDKKHTKVFQASSTRIDLLLKNAFSYSRKSVDQAFYESRVMLNGKKVNKKGEIMKLGDEADIVHGFHPDNSKFLLVSRIELKAVDVVDEENLEQGIRIKLIKHKNIKVENYNPPWKSSVPQS